MEIFESLLHGLVSVCAGFRDSRRRADVDYTMADIGLSAFSLFFMQSESFLAHQRRLEQGCGASNCRTLFGMNKIPTDNYIRLRLDQVAPGHAMVLPLMPEFISAQDGAEKQDCERNAAKRWLIAHGERIADLRPVYLGDDLFCCQPLAEAVLATGADFLFVSKKDSHKTLYEYVEGAPLQQRAVTQRRPGGRTLTYRFRWIESVPLRDGKDAMSVNWLGVRIADAKGKTTYDGAFVTSLPLAADNVAEIAACARARWKIENESFNVLKNNGYHLAHNFGHGKKYLARTFAAMNLLAFAFHTACDCMETLWQQARKAIPTRSRFFQDARSISAYIVFPSWQSLMITLSSGKPPPI